MLFKNYELNSLLELLYNIPLRGKDSRMRTRFNNILKEQIVNVLDKERMSLIEDYAEKDENGEMVSAGESSVKIKDEYIAEFQKELTLLLNEELHIEENESNKMMLLSVADTMLEGDFEVSGEIAELYDMWCEKFEAVKELYKISEEV